MTIYSFLPNSLSHEDMEYFERVNHSHGEENYGDWLESAGWEEQEESED